MLQIKSPYFCKKTLETNIYTYHKLILKVEMTCSQLDFSRLSNSFYLIGVEMVLSSVHSHSPCYFMWDYDIFGNLDGTTVRHLVAVENCV